MELSHSCRNGMSTPNLKKSASRTKMTFCRSEFNSNCLNIICPCSIISHESQASITCLILTCNQTTQKELGWEYLSFYLFTPGNNLSQYISGKKNVKEMFRHLVLVSPLPQTVCYILTRKWRNFTVFCVKIQCRIICLTFLMTVTNLAQNITTQYRK